MLEKAQEGEKGRGLTGMAKKKVISEEEKQLRKERRMRAKEAEQKEAEEIAIAFWALVDAAIEKEARKKKNGVRKIDSFEKLANRMKKGSAATLYNQRSRNQLPKMFDVIKIAKAFDIPVDMLIPSPNQVTKAAKEDSDIRLSSKHRAVMKNIENNDALMRICGTLLREPYALEALYYMMFKEKLLI